MAAEDWVGIKWESSSQYIYVDKNSQSRQGDLAKITWRTILGNLETSEFDCVRRVTIFGDVEQPVKGRTMTSIFDLACAKSYKFWK